LAPSAGRSQRGDAGGIERNLRQPNILGINEERRGAGSSRRHASEADEEKEDS